MTGANVDLSSTVDLVQLKALSSFTRHWTFKGLRLGFCLFG